MGQARNVKLEDIARELGVSIVSVSNALKGKKGVSENLRLRVRKKAEEMGYRMEEERPAAARNGTIYIGVVIAERYVRIYPSFYMDVYRQIAQEAAGKGCLTILHIVEQAEEQSPQKLRLFMDIPVQGVLAVGEMNPEYVEQIRKKSGVPMVCLDFYEMGQPDEDGQRPDYIVVDNFHGMERLTRRVIAYGHERIGFVGTPLATKSIMDRYMGYCKAMEEKGLALRKDWLLYDRAEDGYSTILDVRLPEELPTAFVCNCDRSARLLIDQLARRSLRVPEDISVAAFDHSYVNLAEGLVMTTYECEERVLAQIGLKTLLKRMEGKGKRAGIRIVEGKLVEGNTVARVKE